MFIAMNRFRVAKGSEADFEQVWLSRDSHLDKVPGFVEFHSRAPRLKITPSMLLIRYGKTVLYLKLGPSRRRFGQRTVGQGRISRSIWIIRSSRGSSAADGGPRQDSGSVTPTCRTAF